MANCGHKSCEGRKECRSEYSKAYGKSYYLANKKERMEYAAGNKVKISATKRAYRERTRVLYVQEVFNQNGKNCVMCRKKCHASNFACFDLHHIDPSKKEFSIGLYTESFFTTLQRAFLHSTIIIDNLYYKQDTDSKLTKKPEGKKFSAKIELIEVGSEVVISKCCC